MKEYTYYPLTAGQMILLYSQKYSTKKQINNVCATVNILNDIDPKLLYQAIYMASMRYPSMNCRFTPQGKDTVQYFADSLPENISMVDFSDASPEDIQKAIDAWGAVPFPNSCMDVPLYRIRILKMPGNKLSLYFCICHLIMDAYAIMSFIKYTEQVYGALLRHTPIPDIKSTPIECYQGEQEYFSSDRYKRDQEFWDQYFTTEPTFTSVNGKDAKEFDKGAKTGVSLRLYQVTAEHLNLRIPADTVAAVQKLCMEKRFSPQCAYILAVRSFLGAVSGTDDVMMMNTVARRATIVQKHAGGTMVNAIPFRSIIPGSVSFLEGISRLYAIQREIYRHSDMPCGELLNAFFKYHRKDGIVCHSYYSTSLTFQPYFTSEGTDLSYTFKREKNGAATMPLYISIMPYDSTGDLWCNYEYLKGFIKPESIEHLHSFLLKFLKAGAAHPEASIEELVKKSL